MRVQPWLTMLAILCATQVRVVGDGTAQAQGRGTSVYVNTPVAILAPPGSGGTARVDLSATPPRLVHTIRGLTLPSFLACGPDRRLYVSSARMGLGQITRYDQDGGNPTVVAAFPWEDPSMAPTPILLAPNGDMYYGVPGNWGLRRLDRADPSRTPTQTAPPRAFRFNARPHAFLTAGPYRGDLLLVDNPFNGRPDPQTRVLRAKAPDFREVVAFLTGGDFHGLAVNSAGEIFVTDYAQAEVRRHAPDGRLLGRIGMGHNPNQIAIDSTDTLWVQTGGPSFAAGPPFPFVGGLFRIQPGREPEPVLGPAAGAFGVTACGS